MIGTLNNATQDSVSQGGALRLSLTVDHPVTKAARASIVSLSSQLSLPTITKALGVIEGAHRSKRRGGCDDMLDIRPYEVGEEVRLVDWKISARVGNMMVVQRERPSTTRMWLILDASEPMLAHTPSDERAIDVAVTSLLMNAAVSLRRGDEVSFVYADSQHIARQHVHGTYAHCLSAMHQSLNGHAVHQRNTDALISYVQRIKDRNAIVMIATDEHALQHRHIQALTKVAAAHPLMIATATTINPFEPSSQSVSYAPLSKRIPAMLQDPKASLEVKQHRAVLDALLHSSLKRVGAHVFSAGSSLDMVREYMKAVHASSTHAAHYLAGQGKVFTHDALEKEPSVTQAANMAGQMRGES